MRRALSGTLALIVVGGLTFMPAAAPRADATAVFFVGIFGDRVDAAPGDGLCADSGGMCTLRAAIQEANVLAGVDTIVLAPGVFRLSRAGTGPGGGDLDIHSSVLIEGAGAGRSVIDADGTGDRVLEVDDTEGAIQVVMRHLDLRGGRRTAGEGAGIRVAPAGAGLRLELDGIRLRGNRVRGNAATDAGGGLWIGTGAKVVALETTVERNRAHEGGGVRVAPGGSLRLQRSAVVRNRAFDGGGVVAAGSVALVSSTVSSNPIGSSGVGGVLATGGSLSISGSTLAGGPSALGSAAGATVTIAGSIVKGGCSLAGVTDEGGHNLDGGTSCGFTKATDLPSTPPRLGLLTDNGGPSPTHALDPRSLAVGAAGTGCSGSDQRGVPRHGDACDIGSYEYVGCLGRPVDVVGTAGPDVIRSGGRADTILPLDGNDIVRAGAGDDRVCAQGGDDWIAGGSGSDHVKGGTGRDWCDGGRGQDVAVCEVERRVP